MKQMATKEDAEWEVGENECKEHDCIRHNNEQRWWERMHTEDESKV